MLPFEDFSKNRDQEWFSDGLTEEILNSLARLQGLKVAARTSSFYFKGKNIPISQIADTLGVEHIVEGSVRRADSTMRITAQLIKADSGFHLWSKTYDRHISDVFEVQGDIAENIAAALDVYLDEEAREKMFAFGTRNVLAYNAYLKGRNIYDELHNNRNIDTNNLFEEANKWFEQAIQLDPNFSAPYYYHSDAYLHYLLDYAMQLDSLHNLSINEAHSRMMADFAKAIEHANPGQKLIYKLEKTFLSDDWSQISSLVEDLKNSPEAQRAYAMLGGGWTRTFLSLIGHAHLQYQLSDKALKRDPLDRGLKASKIQALMSFATIGRIEQALNEIVRETGSSGLVAGARYFAYLMDKNIEKADSLAQSIDSSATHPLNVFIQAVKGRKEEARKNYEKFGNKEFKNSFQSATVHYAIGNVEKANALALVVDTLALGPQKLMTQISNSGGLLGFDIAEMPNLSERFKEAGVEVEPIQIGQVTLHRIVQKEL